MSGTDSQSKSTGPSLALPAPADPSTEPRTDGIGDKAQMDVDGKSVPLDHLGPMIINTDGTISRITNWLDMTEDERKRTLRLLVKRNRVRLATQKPEGGEALGIAAD
ncbi:unnamed protein product [Peniophora sp. CBMAI 1063]|nr:unnamed protein product [Peniophora sp. CBMAI 1063]